MFYIKSPAPFFRHPPRGHTNTAPDTATPVLGKGRGDVCKIALYHEEETPPLFPLPPNPLPSRLYLWPPDPQPVKPRPCLMASASQPEP